MEGSPKNPETRYFSKRKLQMFLVLENGCKL